MSIAAMHWAKRQRTGSPTTKAVLLAIADYADDTGLAWPSQKTLAFDTELTDRSIRNALVALEDAGLLTREEHRRADGTQAADRIRLALRSQAESSSTGQAEGHSEPAERGSKQAEPVSDPTTFEPPLNYQEPSKGESASDTRRVSDLRSLSNACFASAGQAMDRRCVGLEMMSTPAGWLSNGCDLELDVLPTLAVYGARASPGSIRTWGYFDRMVAEARDRRMKPLPTVSTSIHRSRPNDIASAFDRLDARIAEARSGSGGGDREERPLNRMQIAAGR